MHPLLIYIHGFKSSSQSQKAEEVRQYVLKKHIPIDFLAPTFANYPGQSHQQLQQIIIEQRESKREKIALIGSSLGGFMANSVTQMFGLKAVLINPAVYPDKLIHHFLGENINPHTGERFYLRDEHIQELQSIEPSVLNYPKNILVMLQTADETLDYRIAKEYYRACTQVVESGGDHRFQRFDKHLPAIMEFLELTDY